MAFLAPSLKRLFNELDDVWPKRDRRTDGWYRNCKWEDHGTDHCPTPDGMVHAIDIDKDGIDADWVVSRLIKLTGVVRYVIWNRHIWEAKDGWRKEDYSGTSNPHTDHIHVSIEHTDKAEQWNGGFGIAKSIGEILGEVVGAAVMPNNWDHGPNVGKTADAFVSLAAEISGYTRSIKDLRQ